MTAIDYAKVTPTAKIATTPATHAFRETSDGVAFAVSPETPPVPSEALHGASAPRVFFRT